MAKDPKKNYQYVKEWRERNRDKVHEQYERRKARDPEKVKQLNKIAKVKYRESHLEQVREQDKIRAREKRKNDPETRRIITERARARKQASQEKEAGRPRSELCEVCNEFNRWIVFDHCHTGGHFRGWICDRCNKVLGLVYDNDELLMKLAEYIWRDRGRTNDETT